MEDSVPNSVWAVRVLRHAVRTHKRPGLFPAMDERDFERISGYLLCAYLDDILVFSQTLEECRRHV